MAARRLIIVMLVLLGISTGVAIVAPGPEEQTVEAQSGDGESEPDSGATDGESVEGASGDGASGEGASGDGAAGGGTGGGAAGDAASETGPGGDTGATGATGNASGRTFTTTVFLSTGTGIVSVCARPGSRLVLTVRTASPVDLSIPEFGRTASATEYAPSIFDLLMPEEPGRYEIEALDTGRTLGRIVNNRSCSRPDGEGDATPSNAPEQAQPGQRAQPGRQVQPGAEAQRPAEAQPAPAETASSIPA
jgi:hypothetical protein